MTEDIYPLGQGQGLMTDALNFALNNLYQYGQRTAESNKRTGEIFEGIRSGQRPDLSPLLQDAASINPVGGMIKPATWNAMQPEMKAALNVFGEKYPSTFGAVLASRPNLTGQVTKDLPSGATATLRNVTPEEQLMKVRPFYAASTPTIGHELQHALNVERVAKTHPLDALTIATLLKEQLPASNRGSLDTILGEVLAKEPVTSKIGRKFSGAPEPPLQIKPGTSRGLMRVAMDEALAYLGQNAAQGPKRTGSLDPMIQELAEKLGVKWGGTPYAPPSVGAVTPALAAFRHGTDPKAALGIIREGLRPGSSISKTGGRDFEGYPVTFEFDDVLRGAKDYGSPLGKTMHEGAAQTGKTAKKISRVFFDPEEYQFKEDALDIFRKLRQELNATGRKDLKIEGARWNDPASKWEYGGTPSLKNLPSFQQHIQKTNDKSLQRMFDETLDNMWNVPEEKATALNDRLDKILAEMERRGMGTK